MRHEARHVSVLRRMFQVGEPVEFIEELTDYDEATDTHSNHRILRVSGHAVAITGDTVEYERMNLLKKDPVTLLFVPDVFGEEPGPESDISWKSKVRKARKVKRLALGAKVILV